MKGKVMIKKRIRKGITDGKEEVERKKSYRC